MPIGYKLNILQNNKTMNVSSMVAHLQPFSPFIPKSTSKAIPCLFPQQSQFLLQPTSKANSPYVKRQGLLTSFYKKYLSL